MTYAQFLGIFLLVPIALLSAHFKKSEEYQKKAFIKGILVLIFLAVTYTTPWDNYLVKTKVWWYGPDKVIGTIGYVPIEEYAFFVLQTIMSGLWCFLITRQVPFENKEKHSGFYGLGVAFWTLATLIGVVSLFFTNTTYLGLILAWASPIVLIQWIFGGKLILANMKNFLLSVGIPTVFLWFADGIAIHLNIWEISAIKTIGLKAGPLPFEEALFFLMTNLMVVQGLMLFVLMEDRLNSILDRFNGRRIEHGH